MKPTDGRSSRYHGKKMKTFFHRGALGILVAMAAQAGFAQTSVSAAAGSAQNLENSGASARAYGMGTAFVGVADDAAALFFNPAGLAGLRLPQLALNHNGYLAGTFQETLIYGFPAGDWGGMAAAVNYISWGSLDLRDIYGVSQGSYNDTDVGLVFGWGKEWFKGLSAGLSLQAVQQKVVDSLYNSLSLRLGILGTFDSHFKLGAAYSNLGTEVGGSPLSQSLQGGGSYGFDLGKKRELLLAFSGDWEPQGISSLQFGLEGGWESLLVLRGGYEVPLDGQIAGGSTAFSLGAGVKLGSFNLDYAYVPFGDFGVSNRISLGYEFPSAPKEVVQVPVTVIQQVLVSPPTPVPTPATPDSSKTAVQVKFKVPAEGAETVESTPAPTSPQVQTGLQLVKDDPQNPKNWWNLGNLYFQAGQKESAIQCFEQVLRLNPDNLTLKAWLENYKDSKP